jgi:multiple sugar transport system substrate-binding protein
MQRTHPAPRRRGRFTKPVLATIIIPMLTLPAPSAYAATQLPNGTKTVTVTLLKNYDTSDTIFNNTIVTQFEAANPGIKIALDRPPTTAAPTFETLVAGGGNPNIVYRAGGADVAAPMDEGALIPLDYKAMGLSGYNQLVSQYNNPQLVSSLSYKGVQYGFPEQVSDYGAFINKAQYSAAGLSIPTTWAQVCADGPKLLTMKDGVVTHEELGLPVDFGAILNIMGALAVEFGSPLFNSSGTKSYLTSKPVVHAFQMVQNLVYKCHAASPALTGTVPASERVQYGQGKASMVLDVGSWYTPTLQDVYPSVWKQTTVTEYPSNPGAPHVSVEYEYEYVVNRSAGDPAATWKFMQFLHTEKVAEEALTLGGLYYGLKSEAGFVAKQNYPFWDTVWAPSLKVGVFLPELVNLDQIDTDLTDTYVKIITTDANVTSALAGLQSQIAPLLNKS